MPYQRVPNLLCAVLFLAVIQSGCGDSSGVNDPAPAPAITDSPTNDDASTSAESAGQGVVPPMHCYFHKEEQPHAAEWGYDGDTSPVHWGDLSPEYVLAKTGRRQSPIDIVGAVAAELPKTADLNFAYGPSKIDLVYNGHTVEEIEDHKSSITVYGKRFALQ